MAREVRKKLRQARRELEALYRSMGHSRTMAVKMANDSAIKLDNDKFGGDREAKQKKVEALRKAIDSNGLPEEKAILEKVNKMKRAKILKKKREKEALKGNGENHG